jgi:N-formylglutamate amidohydrolase
MVNLTTPLIDPKNASSALLEDGVLEILRPRQQTLPVVFSSPHSGTNYTPEFTQASKLDSTSLRKSEDSFVDEIFAAAPGLGAPLLKALFPRAYIDPNREPFELDPEMFKDPLPTYVNCQSARVAAGLGTIARVVATGSDIYKDKLSFTEAADRINRLYRPYHKALQGLLEETRAAFGWCLLIDCHSMPSVGGPMDQDPGSGRVDFVLGDCYGAACHSAITDHVETMLTSRNHSVTRNIPYSGGYTTMHYGRPDAGVHALQIEINRGLYMDEDAYARSDGMAALIESLTALIGSFQDMVHPTTP